MTRAIRRDVSKPDQQADLDGLVGQHLGRYQIGAEIASGGMATVYLAFLRGEAAFEKVVAIKCIHPHLAKDPSFVEMFMDEARIASRITHPNVVHIFDFGHDGDRHYLAMEHLVGAPYAQVRRQVAKESTSAAQRLIPLRMLADVCEGLHAVHELKGPDGLPLGVVHRDVSPQNVLVTFDGATKLLDFGIARGRDQLHRTATGELKGNFPYIAPEHVAGESFDRRADLWSVGVMLWEQLAGRRLFSRKTAAETLYAVAHEFVRRVDAIDREVPRELADVVARCLTRDPARRFGDARELGRAIQRAAAPLGPWPSQADVADWMEHAFPGEQEQQEARVRDALRAADRSVQTKQRRRRGLIAATALALGAVAGALAIGMSGGGLEPSATSQPPGQAVAPLETVGGEPTELAAPTEASDPTTSPTASDPTTSDPNASDPTLDPTATDMAEPALASRRRRTMRRQPMESSMGAPGRVVLVTPDGWAEVWSGGERLGVTPLRASLPAGTRSLELRPFGMRPGRWVRVEVPSEGTVRRSVSLSR